MLNQTDTILGSDPPPSAYLESYRVLRSSVLAMREREPFRTALITSPGEREGKTTVAINLATMLGLIDKRTILVDADFYGSGIDRALDIPPESPGLTDLCRGDAELDEVLMPTEVEQFSLLPAGTDPDRGPELIATGAMERTVAQVRDAAEYVLFDCTPVTGFGAAVSIAPLVDVVLLVVLARSQVMNVRRCLEAIEQVGGTIGGVVVNDVLPGDSAAYRSYHRYYE